MHKKLVVVADDFTGANDAGVEFNKAGLAVRVIIDPAFLTEEIRRCDILVVDLESRSDNMDEAYEKYFLLGKQLSLIGNIIVYKKIDSTFRGNIGAEIDGLMDALDLNFALLASAFPANGRTTENGEVFIHGVRLEETEAAVDPRTPVKLSRIAEIVGLQSRRASREVSSEIFQEEFAEGNQFIENRTVKSAEILIFDSREEKDLEKIALGISGITHLNFLIVGSAGLASHLRKAAFTGQQKVAFVFGGSVSARSFAQMKYTLDAGNCKLIFIDGENLLNDNYMEDEIIQSVTKSIAQGNTRFIFTAAVSRQDVESVFRIARQKSISPESAAKKIAQGIGRFAAILIETFHPRGVLLTGGETAINTVKALQATGIDIGREILPGVPCGTLTGCPVRSLIATKSGGFGDRDAISKTLDFFMV